MHRGRWLKWATLGQELKSIRPGPWMVPVGLFIALYLWRPFALGFYSDDWSSLILVVGLPSIGEQPVFGDNWGMSAAVANKYPDSRFEGATVSSFKPGTPT